LGACVCATSFVLVVMMAVGTNTILFCDNTI
jgi:hypothetical protein